MPLADYFQKDLGTEWCKPPDVSKTFKVYNNAPTYLVIAFSWAITSLVGAIGSQQYGLFGLIGSAIAFLVLAMVSIKSVRREGDSLVLQTYNGGFNIELSNIESLKVGYKYSCCDCKRPCCGVYGDVGKIESSNVLITLKQKVQGAHTIIISVMDNEVQEFINSVVANQENSI